MVAHNRKAANPRKSINQQTTKSKTKANKPKDPTRISGRGRADGRMVTICYLKCPLATKYDTCNSTRKCGSFTGKRTTRRNCP
jgi:hypothetical protein